MNPAKLGKLGSRTQREPSSLGFVALALKPANPAFNVLMNPAKLGKLGKLGFWTQVILVSWVLEPSEPSSKSFVALPTNPASPAKTWLFICLMNPAKLSKLGSRTRLTWVTCSLGSARLTVFKTQLKPRFNLGWTQLSILG